MKSLGYINQMTVQPKKDTIQKSLGNRSVFGKGTELVLKISQAVLSLHKKEKLTLKHREGKHISFFKQHFVFVLCSSCI